MIKFYQLCFYLCMALSLNAHATDTYNDSNNQLSIPAVILGSVVYRNVLITVDRVLTVGGSSQDAKYAAKPSHAFDTYDPTTNQLSIPNVNAFGLVYHDVVVSVGKVLFVGSSSPWIPDSGSAQNTHVSELLQRIKNAIAAVTAASFNSP